jgi:rod shape-determining protein MreB
LERSFNLANNAFGIDLGTNNIKIYSRSDDNILVEKNMIAIENKNTLFAYGDSAFEMYEKAPDNIDISYPLSSGVIADIRNMETLIKYFISDLQKGNIKPADFLIAIPKAITDVEQRAFYDLLKEAGVKAKKIMVVYKAVADGLGLDIDVKNSQGVLVVNVGYDTTEISILSLGGIVLSRLIKVGGLKFDEAIKAAVRREFSLVIGGKTAETVKISLGELEAENRGALVYGRDIVTGLPVEREIPTKLVDEALSEHFNTIIDNVKVILERTPPELAADIYRHGIYLTGGASQVNHLAEKLAKGTGLKVNMSENPVTSVALGLAKIIKDDNYKSVASTIEGMSK